MASQWLTQFMADLNNPTTATRQPTIQEMAADIIRKSNAYHYKTPVHKSLSRVQLVSASSKDKKGPNVFSRAMDLLSRPEYAVTNALTEMQQKANKTKINGKPNISVGDFFSSLGHGAVQGFEGKKKTTVADIYKASGRSDNKGFLAGVRNFALTAAVDPLNMFPGTAIAKAIKGGSKAKGALHLGDIVHTEGATATERVSAALKKPYREVGAKPVHLNKARQVVGGRSLPNVNKIPIPYPRVPIAAAAKVVPKASKSKTAKVLAEVIATPGRTIDVMKLVEGKIPRAAVGKSPATHKLYTRAGKVKIFNKAGKAIGEVDAKQVDAYIRSGKITAPKGKELVDPAKHLFSDKTDPAIFHIKQVDSKGTISYKSLASMRAKNAAVSKSTVVPTSATAWRKLAREHGLTKVEQDAVIATKDDLEAIKLLRSYTKKAALPKAKPKTQPKVVVGAEDLVVAAGEGSQPAVKAMEEAVKKNLPKNTEVISENGGKALSDAVDETIAGIRTGNKYNLPRANPHFNPAKQVNALGRLEAHLVRSGEVPVGKWKTNPKLLETISTTKAGKVHPFAKMRRSAAMKHLVAFEDKMIEAGHPPTLFDGTPARLSDLINAAGGVQKVLAMPGVNLTDIFGNDYKFAQFLADNPAAMQLAESARAAQKVEDARLIKEGKDAAISAAVKAENDPALSASEVAAARTAAPAVAAQVVKASSKIPNPEAARMAVQSARELLDHARPAVERVTEKHKAAFEHTVWTGKITPETVAGQVARNHAALAVMELTPKDIATDITGVKQATGLIAALGKAFIPDWGQTALRKYSVENRSIAQTNTALFDAEVNKMHKVYTPDQLKLGWKAMQTGRPVGDPAVQAAGEEYRRVMETMFGSSGFKDAATTDILRESIRMQDINEALRVSGGSKVFQFTNEVKDELGKTVKLEHWSDSWKYHNLDGQHPSEFLHKMRDAVDHAMMHKTMFDEIAADFGRVGKKTSVDHPRLQGIEFTPEIASQVRRFIEVAEQAKHKNSTFMKNVDAFTSIWKKGITYYLLGHHMRNLTGDMSIAFMQGVHNPDVYRRGALVLKSHKDLYTGWDKLDNLIAPGGQARALSRTSGKKIVRGTWQGGSKALDASQVHQIMYSRGLMPSSKAIEDIPTSEGGTLVDRAFTKAFLKKDAHGFNTGKILGGRGKRVAQHTSEVREHFVRAGHWIDAFEKAGKNGAKSLDEAIQYATDITRKFHPDGLDLTHAEHTYIRRVFPFYSWTRKAIPLLAETGFKHPAYLTAPNKALYNAQVAMGLNPYAESDAFPQGKQYPDWIRDLPWGPTSPTARYIMGNNLLPGPQLEAQFLNNPVQSVKGFLNPAINVPMELMSGVDSQTGQKLSGPQGVDKTQWAAKQIPLVSTAASVSGRDLLQGGGPSRANVTGNESSNRLPIGLANLLGAGVIDAQSQGNVLSAQFDQKARVAVANKAAKLKRAGG